MIKKLLVIAFAAASLLAPAIAADGQSAPAWAATGAACIDHYRRTLVFLKNNAEESGLNSEQLNSLGNPDDYSDPVPGQVCVATLPPLRPGLEQRDSQEQIKLVNICAARTTKCTIKRVRGGMDCMAAVYQCMSEFPIPKAIP